MEEQVGVTVRKFIAGLIIAILVSCVVSAAVYPCAQAAVGWSKTYGGTGEDTAVWLIQTTDGGYAMLGYTSSFGAGGNDFWLVKTDTSGNMQWNKTYGGTGTDRGFTVIQTIDGGYLMAGPTNSFGAGLTDGWLVRTDADGNMQWNKTYGTPAMETANYVIQTSDGGYAVMGLKLPSLNAWVFKTDANGNMQWNKTYTAAKEQVGITIIQTTDGGYTIGGGGEYTDGFQAWLAKTDSSGNMLWNKTYGTNHNLGSGLVQTDDGGYAIAGHAEFPGTSGMDGWLFKTDADGNIQWNKTYGGTSDEQFVRIIRTLDGGFAMSGLTNSYGAGGSDVWVVKTDSYGNMQWNKTFGGSGNEDGQMLRQTSDGGYAIVANTASFGAGGNDFWVLKTDELGVVPEGLTLGVMVLLSTAAVVASARYFRKRLRIKNFSQVKL